MIISRELASWVAGVMVCCVAASGCTVIRYRDPDGGGVTVVPVEPPVVDVLVLVDLDTSAATFATPYQRLLDSAIAAFEEAGVDVRRVAVAPLAHRVGGAVPLIAGGSPDEIDLAGAIAAYTTGELASFLEPQVDGERSNLLELGAALVARSIYRPTPGSPGSGMLTGEAFFEPAEDGWIVVTLSGRAAPCDAGACPSAAVEHAGALLLTDPESSTLVWLRLPGEDGLPAGRVFHLFVTPPEVGDSYTALSSACTARPNFPVGVLDAMQPSEVYRSEVARGLSAGGGRGSWIDLCGALSSDGPNMLRSAARAIAGAL